MAAAPQTLSKSLASDVSSTWHDMLPVPAMLSDKLDFRVLDEASFRRLLLRPQKSPHLALLGTVVLRV